MSVPKFALGMVEIGRPWGFRSSPVPDERAAVEFLRGVFEAGVEVYDTAPSYAYSEQRFGLFLKELTPQQRAGITVATKFGESWDFERNEPVGDHSYDGLMRSLENSLRLLGRIDVLQVHKSTPEVLRSDGVRRALEAALGMGIGVVGASVKDLESARIACEEQPFTMLQLPYNRVNRQMEPAIELARASGRAVYANRPFGEGRLLAEGVTVRSCIEFLVGVGFEGAILFGTSSLPHLLENVAAYREVVS